MKTLRSLFFLTLASSGLYLGWEVRGLYESKIQPAARAAQIAQNPLSIFGK